MGFFIRVAVFVFFLQIGEVLRSQIEEPENKVVHLYRSMDRITHQYPEKYYCVMSFLIVNSYSLCESFSPVSLY